MRTTIAGGNSTISHMLSRPEYLGHTVNFKTYRKSYKQKKQLKRDPSEWQILEGIRDITAYVREHEDEFVQATMHKSQEEMRKSQREARKILEASEA